VKQIRPDIPPEANHMHQELALQNEFEIGSLVIRQFLLDGIHIFFARIETKSRDIEIDSNTQGP
jgi:hypothetical protein